MANRAVRQGDVLIVPLEPDQTITGTPVAPVNGRYLLALGEQTGHHHSVPALPNVMLLADGPRSFLSVKDQAVPLEHQEHYAHAIEPGDHEVIVQRRPTAASSEMRVRAVLD